MMCPYLQKTCVQSVPNFLRSLFLRLLRGGKGLFHPSGADVFKVLKIIVKFEKSKPEADVCRFAKTCKGTIKLAGGKIRAGRASCFRFLLPIGVGFRKMYYLCTLILACMSKQKREYRVVFSGLEDGVHRFEFAIGQDFMELFPETDVFFAPIVRVEMEMRKNGRLMEMEFRFEGSAKTRCDRCLQEVEFPVSWQESVVAKVSAEVSRQTEEDDYWAIPEKESAVDLASYFHEILVLSRPMQCFCPENEDGIPACDPGMLAFYGRKEEEEAATDPRWSALAELRSRMESED